MAPPKENKELVRRHFAAFNDHDWDGCADTLAADVAFHQAGETHRGVDWLISHYKDFYDTFPDASITIDDMVAEDDRVTVRITNIGTHEGEFAGIDPTGNEIEFSSHLIIRVEDGTLAELWVVAEQLRVYQQLGAIEPPGE